MKKKQHLQIQVGKGKPCPMQRLARPRGLDGLHRDGLHLDLVQLHDLGRHLRAVRGDIESVARGHG